MSGLQYVQGKVRYVLWGLRIASRPHSQNLICGLAYKWCRQQTRPINVIRSTYIDLIRTGEVVDFSIVVDQYIAQDKQRLISNNRNSRGLTLARWHAYCKNPAGAARYGVRVSCKMNWRIMEYGVGDHALN